MSFKIEDGPWSQYRNLPELDELDLHFGKRDPWTPYGVIMNDVHELVVAKLKSAQTQRRRYLLITHGWSTSRCGKTTARSVVRALMRSREATPYIIRSQCIQHESVFVAAIRPLDAGARQEASPEMQNY